MQHRKIVLVASVLALALAGCGSQKVGQASPAPTSTAAAPAPNPGSTSASAAPAGDGTLTPTGTTLAVGKTATVYYPIKDLSKETTKFEVTTASVKKGAISDLKNFDLDAQTKVSEPFYVTLKFRNAGKVALEPKGIFGLVEVYNTEGDQLNRLSLIGDFKPCDGSPPDSLAPGASFTECDVYVAPAGQQADKVVFGFYVDLDKTEITWKG